MYSKSQRPYSFLSFGFFILWLLGFLPVGCMALSQYEYLEVVKQFADSYLSPGNVAITDSINSTLFAEDVTGTADLSTNFDGRELSTEYLFGLFVNTAKDATAPSIFGQPISYNITSAAVQHNTVSTSVKFEFYYPSLNQSFPIQIDAWFYINEQRQIQQYDVAFRRWSWATDVIIPLLIPKMADFLNVTNTNATFVLQEYLAQQVCNAELANCNGTNQQYDNYDDCHSFVTSIPLGEFYRMGENNLICRALHTPMLPLRPSVHCPHVGPTGGDMCIPRDYNQVVLDSHFPAGWLAPKFVTPENQYLVGNIQAVSGTDLDSLLELSMNNADLHSWTVDIYPTAILGYLLFYYFCGKILWFVYFRRSSVFPTLILEHQKNVVMYTMNIIFTTIALGLELVAAPAFARTYHLWGVRCLRCAGVIISSLYIFELVYRLKMRFPMIVHHILTIVAISFTVTVFEYTQDPTLIVSAIIWLFQATTEQPTFVGLLGYRLDWSPLVVSRILRAAAVQTFVIKSTSAIGILVYWGLHQNRSDRPMDVAWTALVWIIAVTLLLTQIWGSYVTYTIGSRLLKDSHLPANGDYFNKSSLTVYQTVKLNQKSSQSISTTVTVETIDEGDPRGRVETTIPSYGGENEYHVDGPRENWDLEANREYIPEKKVSVEARAPSPRDIPLPQSPEPPPTIRSNNPFFGHRPTSSGQLSMSLHDSIPEEYGTLDGAANAHNANVDDISEPQVVVASDHGSASRGREANEHLIKGVAY